MTERPRDDPGLHEVMRRDIERLYVRGEEKDVEEALARVVPRPVPSIVITLFRDTARGVAESLRALPSVLDETVARYPVKLELRLDALPDLSERIAATALVLKIGVPVVLTLRTRTEGGLTTATDVERRKFLDTIIGSLREQVPRGSLLDVEAASVAADPDGWSRTLRLAHAQGFHILLSHHDLEVSPHRPSLLLPPEGLLDRTPGAPALLWKSATRSRTWHEVLTMLRAMREGDLHGRRHAIMGLGDIEPRLLAPFFAAPLVYASVRAQDRAAPGQTTVADLAHLWARWGVMPDDTGLVSDAGEDGSGRPRWCLLGRPAWHSLSPAMHNAAARRLGLPSRYFPLELPTPARSSDAELVRETLDELPGLGVLGGNVTAPFKETVATVADRLEGDAARLGTVNTFRIDGDDLVGLTTDTTGIRDALQEAGVPCKGKVLILGAGGSATATVDALRDADQVVVAARTEARAHAMARKVGAAVEVVPWEARAAAAASSALVVNTTPIGAADTEEGRDTPIPRDALHAGQAVLDLVYATPSGRTRLLEDAAQAGARTVDGLAVLLHQGAAAFRVWTHEEPPVETMRAALQAAALIPFPIGLRGPAAPGEVRS